MSTAVTAREVMPSIPPPNFGYSIGGCSEVIREAVLSVAGRPPD
jgi:hypothetical protein